MDNDRSAVVPSHQTVNVGATGLVARSNNVSIDN